MKPNEINYTHELNTPEIMIFQRNWLDVINAIRGCDPYIVGQWIFIICNYYFYGIEPKGLNKTEYDLWCELKTIIDEQIEE